MLKSGFATLNMISYYLDMSKNYFTTKSAWPTTDSVNFTTLDCLSYSFVELFLYNDNQN